jgi:hypothetical protein
MGAIEDVVAQLRARGINAEEMPVASEPNSRFVLLREFEIDVGRLSGTRADIAIRLPKDFPVSGPTGMDTKPHLCQITGGQPSAIHKSPVGNEWAYWSRPFAEWPSSAKDLDAVMGWFRRVLKNAPAS